MCDKFVHFACSLVAHNEDEEFRANFYEDISTNFANKKKMYWNLSSLKSNVIHHYFSTSTPTDLLSFYVSNIAQVEQKATAVLK